jgi:hypothetical protein
VTYMTWSSESKLGPHTMRTSVCVGENVTKDGTCETAQRHSNEKRDETPWHLDNKGKSLRARMGGGATGHLRHCAKDVTHAYVTTAAMYPTTSNSDHHEKSSGPPHRISTPPHPTPPPPLQIPPPPPPHHHPRHVSFKSIQPPPLPPSKATPRRNITTCGHE